MTRLTSTRSRLRAVAALLVALLIPTAAGAAWGTENWGEMIWGGNAPGIPALPVWGRIALAMLLAAIPGVLLVRRHRGARV